MSKLSDLRSKGTIITLSNGLKLEVRPMSLDTEATVGELYDKKQFMQGMRFMVKDAIKRAIPDATDDEINELNKLDLKLITETVLSVNGLSQEKKE